MDMAIIPGSFFWFLLFPLNRFTITLLPTLTQYSQAKMSDGTPLLIPEKCVAMIIFMVTLFWYVLWCVRTINQICDFLDIYCLSIKNQGAQTSEKTTKEKSPGKTSKKKSPEKRRVRSPKKNLEGSAKKKQVKAE